MSNIFKGIKQLNEVDPRNFDSDIDYYDALNRKPRGRSEDDYVDPSEKYDEPIAAQKKITRPEYSISDDEDRKAGYNMTLTVKAPTTQAAEWAASSYVDSNWGAKKQIGKITPIADGVVQVHMVDNHKYGMWKPWKDEAPTQKPISFNEEQLDELSPDTLASYKKKAGAHASELDKAAWGGAPDAQQKINKANKRFSGIIRATKKELDNDVKGIKENAEELNMGDPVVVTGDVQFNGTTGDIVGFSNDKHFVIVDLYNHGKRSFHSSDVSFNDYADSDDEHEHINRVAEDEQQSPNTDSILEYLTKAARSLQQNKDMFSPEGWERIKRSYEFLRSYLKDGDYEGFLSAYNEILRSYPDSTGLLIDEMFAMAGLDENATIEDFLAKTSELDEGRVKDIAVQRLDWEDMSPQQFNGQYGRTKNDWEGQFSRLMNPKKAKAKKTSAPKSTRELDYCPTCQRGDNRCVCEDQSIQKGTPITVTSIKGTVYKGTFEHENENSVVMKTTGRGGNPHTSAIVPETHVVAIKKSHIKSMTPELAEDLPPPENARKTQIAGTLPTYKKAADILNKTGVQGKALDFGAGLGMGTGELGPDAHSYEPFPGEKFKPHFVDVTKIPDNSYHKIVNLNVLNVVPNTGEHKIRDSIVKNIGRVLAPGGVALITTRGKDVLTIKGTPGEEPTSMISKIGTYQKGFTQKELLQYIQQTLGKGFEVSSIKLGPAGVMIKKLDHQGVAEGSENILPRGTSVTVLHKGKQVPGKIVRYDAGKNGYSNAYVVDVGGYESIFVPASKIQTQGVAEDTGDNKFDAMMSNVTSKKSLHAREALGLMNELIYQGGASYKEALDQASTSFEIDPAKLHQLYQQDIRALDEAESKPVNMKRWLRDFERREDNNFHTENVLAMAQLVGTPEDVATMKSLVKQHRGFGLSEKQFEIRHAIADRLRPLVKQKIQDSQAQEMEEGKTGPGLWANIHAKRERIKHGSGEKMRKPGSKGAPTADNFKSAQAGTNEDVVDEDWKKVNQHDKTDGMSKKAVKAYRNEHPGSKLQTAVTKKPSELKAGSKDAKRRKSFCARMSGMKGPMKDEHGKQTPKAKALARWNCESIEQMEELAMIAEQKIQEAKNAKQQAAIAIAKKEKKVSESNIMKGIKK